MLLLTNEEIITELSKHCYPSPKYWDEIDLTRKAQLKKMVKYLKGCKGELVSHNNEPFVCTFEIPTDEWMDILKEVDDV